MAKRDNELQDSAAGKMDRRGFFRGGAAMLGAWSAVGLLRPAAEPAFAAETAQSMATNETLSAQTQRALRWAGTMPADWVRPRGNADHNVVIVGGGQTGISIAYGLRRKGIGKVIVIEQADQGKAGIWRDIARMQQLRTPKTLIGPEQGNAPLGFRAWFETLNTPGAFDALDRIPRLAWADYLTWFENISAAQTQYRTRLTDIEPAGDVLRLHMTVDGMPRTVTTRKLVFANGYNGSGGASVPGFIRALPQEKWSHTEKPINFASLKGKVVGVLGAGASAFDAAGTALEQGAAEVHLFSRRAYIGYTNAPQGGQVASPPPRPADQGFSNMIEWAYALPDPVRWRSQIARERSVATVPYDSMMRAVNHDNFRLHIDAPWDKVAVANGKIAVTSRGKTYRFDYVISGTGYQIDLAAQPEFANIHPMIALWRDRYQPDMDEADKASGAYPYLGAGFQFLAREEKDAATLRNIHCANLGASASFNILVGDVPSMVLQPQLVASIARDFMVDGVDLAVNKRSLAAPATAPDPAPYQKAIRS